MDDVEPELAAVRQRDALARNLDAESSHGAQVNLASMIPARIARCALLALWIGSPLPLSAQVFGGVNLAGAEFGETELPGTYGTDYIYPTPAEIDYYVDEGMNAIRIPFRWERLQPALGGPLDGSDLGGLRAIVGYATRRGLHVILDPHNYARYFGELVGSSAVPDAAFADFWARLAAEFADEPAVIFGLMNEPHGMPTQQWLSAANAAIAAIRGVGARNLILVPGNASSGAHSWADDWYGEPNASVMTGVVDPIDHFAFEVHQYLDGNSSGTSPTIVRATIGSERLAGFTDWLRDHGYRGWLGEFAVARATIGSAPGQIGDEALADMLDHIHDNERRVARLDLVGGRSLVGRLHVHARSGAARAAGRDGPPADGGAASPTCCPSPRRICRPESPRWPRSSASSTTCTRPALLIRARCRSRSTR